MAASTVIEILHLTDPPSDIDFKNSSPDNYDKVKSNNILIKTHWKKASEKLCESLAKLDAVCSVKLDLLEKRSSKLHYEDDGVCIFKGQMIIESSDRQVIAKVLIQFCNNNKFDASWLLLEQAFLDDIFKDKKIANRHSLNFDQIKFGTFVNLTTFINHFDSSTYKVISEQKGYIFSETYGEKVIDFVHEKKKMVIKFDIKNILEYNYKKKDTQNKFKFELSYSSLKSCVVKLYEKSYENSKMLVIYFNLIYPPVLYKLEFDEQEEFLDPITDELISSNFWIRENKLPGIEPSTFGKSSVFAVELPQINQDKNMNSFWNLLITIKRFVKIPIYFADILEKPARNMVSIEEFTDTLPFSVQYALLSIFSHTFQASDDLLYEDDNGYKMKKFQEQISSLNQVDSKALEMTLFAISASIEKSYVIRILPALNKLFRIKHSQIGKKKLFKAEIQDIRRSILTPTRLLLLPPQPTLKSRFSHKSDPEYTLRLLIREDNMEFIVLTLGTPGYTKLKMDFIKNFVKEPLTKSIKLGNRNFEFLGSSTSQLRDNGMILYARDEEGQTAESIRNSMGDFKKIRRNVPKYVARLGLAFSQALTHMNIDIKDTKIKLIDDIEGPFKPLKNIDVEIKELRKRFLKITETFSSNNLVICKPTQLSAVDRYNFSDGIGMISPELAEEIYQQLPNECAHKPSAMQIRFGGCKGMLTVNPELESKQIIFRKSMQKFESKDRTLGILKVSAPRTVYLNRPLISILECLQVPRQVFFKMLLDQLRELANAFVCDRDALNLIKKYSSLKLPYETIKNSGLAVLNEPMFKQIIDCMVKFNIELLKSKARIKVPMNQGRTVFGVLDETGILEYGQVFIKITEVDEENEQTELCYKVLKGEVMVTKFPCMHPGDVRKLQAIDVPQLHHIRDCIVFPQQGKRPHPDEMAGSDLDGDEYAIFWNSDLIFKIPNSEPMDFPLGKTKELDHDAQLDDILEFYCEYIMGNNIGLIANAHLAISDYVKNGVFNKLCMKLTSKYTMALDFAKTGVVEELRRNERPDKYPDFMEKHHRKTYLSYNILGQLYRECCKFEVSLSNKTIVEDKTKQKPLFSSQDYKIYKKDASEAFNLYKTKTIYLMERFGIENEAVLLSGSYSKSKYLTGRSESNDMHELLETLVNNVFSELKVVFEDQCSSCNLSEKKQRACAWYNFASEYNQTADVKLFGFPWTIADYLCLATDPN